jgi:hypothetical protein
VAAFRGFVVVSGPPASGKSSLAPALAAELDLPLLAKDMIKDALVEVLDAPDLPRSRELGRAAVHVLLAVARTAGLGVLEGVWHDRTHAPLAALPGPVVAELWNAEVGTPVAGGWPVLEVDTAGEVDVAALAARLVAAARRGVD